MWLRATIQPLDCKWLGAGIMLFFYVKQEQPTLSVLIKKSCCSTLIPWAIVRASQSNMQETGWILRPARLRKAWADGKTVCQKNKPHTHGGTTREPSIGDLLNNVAAQMNLERILTGVKEWMFLSTRKMSSWPCCITNHIKNQIK